MTTPDVRVAVVGAGIAGLAAAHRAAELLGPRDLVVLESADRPGGKITTERVDGFLVEGGPDCFLAAKPAGIELCRQLGLGDRLRPVNPAFRRGYVKRDGRLHPLPEGLSGLVPSRITPLLATRVLTAASRIRVAMEPLAPRRPPTAAEESVAQFITRRFGREAYDWLIEPLLSGIFAGDGRQLSLAAAFPHLAEAERRDRSLLWSMLKSRVAGRHQHPPPGFVTPAGGLSELVDALVSRLPRQGVWLQAPVREIRAVPGGYRLSLGDGRRVQAATVILAVPAFHAADLLEGHDPALAATLRGIPFVSTATVSVAYRRSDVPRLLPGTGYLSPRAEGGDVVACTWTSNKFPGRAPDDRVLLRVFLGRAGNDAMVQAPEGDLRRIVTDELATVLGIAAQPLFWRVFRWPLGLPQYTLGHRDRLERIATGLARLPGLFLAGASYTGAGIPDCITSGARAADDAVAWTRGHAA